MKLIYGAISDNIFYSNRMELKLKGLYANGIYSMDMDRDDFVNSIEVANIEDARTYFKKASNIKLVRGITLNDGIIPENPIQYKRIPIKVKDPTWDNFEEFEIVQIKGVFYPLQSISTSRSYALMDVQELINNKNYDGVSHIKNMTPEIRVAYTFMVVSIRLDEQKRIAEEQMKLALELKEQQRINDLEPMNFLRRVLEETGAVVSSIKKVNRGFEVLWSSEGETINTLFDRNYSVIEAGFCVSGYDTTQSAQSVANLLHRYVQDGDHIHRTRTVR